MDQDLADHTSRDLLMQARMIALASLQTACAPGRRAQLERMIADLDERLTAESPRPIARP